MQRDDFRPAHLREHHMDEVLSWVRARDCDSSAFLFTGHDGIAIPIAEGGGEAASAFDNITVCGATMDSRSVRASDVFFAVPGATFHGAHFVVNVIEAGCRAIITDEAGIKLVSDSLRAAGNTLPGGGAELTLAVITVSDVRASLGELSAKIYGSPTDSLSVIGITGTNGKTTTTVMIRSALESRGSQCGMIGTVATVSGGVSKVSEHTTVEAPALQQIAAHSIEHGDRYLSIEVSSQGVAARRLDGAHFAVIGFLNLQHDHLDFHKTMEAYFQAKAKPFLNGSAEKGVISMNDQWGRRLASQVEIPVLTYAINGRYDGPMPDGDDGRDQVPAGVDYWVSEWRVNLDTGLDDFTVITPQGERVSGTCPIPGEHNIENQMMAALSLCQLGYDFKEALAACSAPVAIPGRLELISVPGMPEGAPRVYVDYAHTSEAIDVTMATLRPRCRGKLICIVGANGDRDVDKRPHMGYAAARWADVVHICDDTPYNDDPLEVRKAISRGVNLAVNDGYQLYYDVQSIREHAMWQIVRDAGDDDVVVFLGRGHEDLQVIHGYDHYLLDAHAARRMLQRRYQIPPETGRLYDDPLYAAVVDEDPRLCEQKLLMTISRAVQATGARLIYVSPRGEDLEGFFTLPAFALLFGAYVDSREVTRSSLYVARRGENTDGHRFIGAALKAGASAIVASDEAAAREQITALGPAISQRAIPVLLHDNPTEALGKLAAGHFADIAKYQRQLGREITTIGITGSAGKTTTKDLLVHILSAAGETVGPERSFNNEVGVPATMLRAGGQTRYLVLEMGASAMGELAYLRQFVDLDIAIELMVGRAHLGGFGSVEQLAKAKSELVADLGADKVAIFNADDPAVMAMGTDAHIRTFSASGQAQSEGLWAADVSVDDAGRAQFTMCAADGDGQVEKVAVHLALTGVHHVNNALAAASAAYACGMELGEIAERIESFTPVSRHRMEIHEVGQDVLVIDDAYNANPDSMNAALRSAAQVAAGRPGKLFAVLGAMKELGEASDALHAEVAHRAGQVGVDTLIVVGEEARALYEAASANAGGAEEAMRAIFAADLPQARAELEKLVGRGDTVIFKGSNGARIWQLAEEYVAGNARGATSM